jgi:hypothetical protein
MRRKIFVGMIILGLLVGVTSLLAQNATPTQSCTPPYVQNIWKTDFCTASVSLDEIMSGGPGKDGIPALTDPAMQSIDDASAWLVDQSPVIAVEIEGEARAYPQAILMWHEIANDVIADVPVSVTFCPLCNSSIVFDRRVNGDVLEFGVSGNLRNSDMVMYDRQTESWWQQFTGEGIVGVYTGTLLDVIPSRVIGFGQFAAQYPDGQVMAIPTNYARSYGQNPYTGYDSLSQPWLFTGDADDRLPAMMHVLAGVIGDTAIAYPFDALQEQQVINDVVEDIAVVAFWQPGVVSALDKTTIDNSREIGTVALYSAEINGETLTFILNNDGTITDEQTNSTWNLFGQALAGDLTGTTLRQLVAAPHFWFAWAAFHPETLVYAGDE